MVSLLNHAFSWAGLVLKAVNQNTCAYSFARNWKLPFLNKRKGEDDCRKYFMIKLHERMLLVQAGIEPMTWSLVRREGPCILSETSLDLWSDRVDVQSDLSVC